MTLETFFEKFDQFADAPGAVGKMRELVLELAVQGGLSEPRDDDEPVDEFLQRIWTNSKDCRFELPEAEKTQPFELPADWRWVVLAEIAEFSIGKTPPRGDSSYWYPEDHSWVSIADMKHYGTITETKEKVSESAAKDVFRQRFAAPGSILMSFKLTIGKVARTAIRCFHNEAIISLRPPEPELSDYLFRLLPIFSALQTSNNAIKGSTLNKGLLTLLPVALPPLAEQKRIVAKVDELMALCDRLEAQQLEREAQAGQLARASLARFADAPTPANLNLLFHSSFPISPSDLRKSILTLAVQGKLVPQDPNDESVEINSECESPFDIPSNWRWKPLERLGTCRTGKTPPTGDPTNYGLGLPFIGPGQITLSGRFTASEKSITRQGLENSTEANAGDILMVCIGGSIGKAAICREPIGFNQQINSVRLQRDLPEFVYLAVTADYFQDQVLANASGSATPIINKGKWEQIPIPIPPLAEQRRIVAKVSELMALVDELETQLAASRAAAEKLLSALVAELTGTTSRLPADS